MEKKAGGLLVDLHPHLSSEGNIPLAHDDVIPELNG